MNDCGYKVVYQTLADAEAAYWRTPATKRTLSPLLPYHCERHGGFHLGHFGQTTARAAWGNSLYSKVFQR